VKQKEKMKGGVVDSVALSNGKGGHISYWSKKNKADKHYRSKAAKMNIRGGK
jgi:hypothetical protein